MSSSIFRRTFCRGPEVKLFLLEPDLSTGLRREVALLIPPLTGSQKRCSDLMVKCAGAEKNHVVLLHGRHLTPAVAGSMMDRGRRSD